MGYPTTEYQVNRTKQDGTYSQSGGSPALSDTVVFVVDVGAHAKFKQLTTALGFPTGVEYAILVESTTSDDWFIALATYDTGTLTLTVTETEEYDGWVLGAGNHAVTCTVLLTARSFDRALRPIPVEVSGATFTITQEAHNRRIIRFTGATNHEITLQAGYSGFHCWLVREGSGTVTLDAGTLTTINGATSDVAISAQWKKALLYTDPNYPLVAFMIE